MLHILSSGAHESVPIQLLCTGLDRPWQRDVADEDPDFSRVIRESLPQSN